MKYKPLTEIASFQQGKQIPVEMQFDKPKNGLSRFVRIIDYTNEGEPPRYIADLDSKYYVSSDDLVMIRYGSQTAGRVVRGIAGIIANNMFQIRINNPDFFKGFLFYYLSSREVNKTLMGGQSSSTMPAITFGMLKNIQVPVFNYKTQRIIASILDSLSNKIEINNSINQNLAEQILALYSDRFDPNSHETTGFLSDVCSYGTEKVPISELSVSNYFSTENMQPNKAGAVDASSLPSVSQTTRCHKGDVLVSNIRPYFKKIVYANEDCGCSTDVLCFNPKEKRYSAFLFGTLYMDRFFDYMVAGSKGTKMPRGDKQQIMNYPIVIPATRDLEEYNEVVTPMLEQMSFTRAENIRLISLRDTLLPKLMSGELDVSELDI